MMLQDALLPEGDYSTLAETYPSLHEEESKKIMKEFTDLHQETIDEHCEALAQDTAEAPSLKTWKFTRAALPEPLRIAIIKYIDERVPEHMMVLKVIMYLSMCKGTVDYIKEKTSKLWFNKVKEQIGL